MHCKDVSVRDTDIPLTEAAIAEMMDGWTAYKRSEYIVLRNGEDLAAVRIVRTGGDDLFQEVRSHAVVSLPADTVYHEDPELDVLNQPALVRVQMRYPGKAVVVCGMFSHINLIKDLRPLRLRVIDSVPPYPSKLGTLVDKALASGFVDLPVVPERTDLDMTGRLADVTTEAVMFPCRVSGIVTDRPCYFLDEAPVLGHEVTLIGCGLSRRIYRDVYGTEPTAIDICPADSVPDDGVHTIVKCCKVKEGHIRAGNTAIVPWGATVPDVVGAVNDLFS